MRKSPEVDEEFDAVFIPRIRVSDLLAPGGVCKFNGGVICNEMFCEKCGWNPVVEKERIRKFRNRKRDT